MSFLNVKIRTLNIQEPEGKKTCENCTNNENLVPKKTNRTKTSDSSDTTIPNKIKSNKTKIEQNNNEIKSNTTTKNNLDIDIDLDVNENQNIGKQNSSLSNSSTSNFSIKFDNYAKSNKINITSWGGKQFKSYQKELLEKSSNIIYIFFFLFIGFFLILFYFKFKQRRNEFPLEEDRKSNISNSIAKGNGKSSVRNISKEKEEKSINLELESQRSQEANTNILFKDQNNNLKYDNENLDKSIDSKDIRKYGLYN